MAEQKKDDLGPGEWAPLDWAPDRAHASLVEARRRVRVQAVATHGWYMRHRIWKSRWSKLLRFLMAVAVGVAAVLPVVELADRDVQVANYGFVALAVGAGLFGLDRVFGLTSGWMRYIATAQAIEAHITRADLRWERLMAQLAGRAPAVSEVVERLEQLVTMTTELHHLVASDTDRWTTELGETQAQLHAAAASATNPPPAGSPTP